MRNQEFGNKRSTQRFELSGLVKYDTLIISAIALLDSTLFTGGKNALFHKWIS